MTSVEPSENDRPERRGMTLGDLAALVAGAALAASLFWYSQTVRARTLAGRPAPGWYVVVVVAREALSKGCIALVPVILARKVRHRGPIRPGEFAALCLAADQLMLALYGWPALGILRPIPGRTEHFEVDEARFQAWNAATLAASALAAFVLATSRRRLPKAVAGLLLVAAWFGLVTPLQTVTMEWLSYRTHGLYRRLPAVGREVLGQAMWLPFVVIHLLPPAFAGLDALRRRPGRTWVEWAGLALALGWSLLVRAQEFLRHRLGDIGPRSADTDAVDAVSTILGIALAFALAGALAPSLRRWLGLDDAGPIRS